MKKISRAATYTALLAWLVSTSCWGSYDGDPYEGTHVPSPTGSACGEPPQMDDVEEEPCNMGKSESENPSTKMVPEPPHLCFSPSKHSEEIESEHQAQKENFQKKETYDELSPYTAWENIQAPYTGGCYDSNASFWDTLSELDSRPQERPQKPYFQGSGSGYQGHIKY